MSRSETPIFTPPMIASGAVAVNRFVTHAGAQAGDGVNALGVSAVAAADGEAFPVVALGTAVIEAGGSFSLGALLQSDTNGKAVTKAAGVGIARALEESTGAGDFVEVLIVPN